MSLTGIKPYSFNRVVTHMENSGVMPYFQIIFGFLRYWGLWFNWNKGERLHFWFANWGEKLGCKVKRTSFVAIDSISTIERERERENSARSHIIIFFAIRISV